MFPAFPDIPVFTVDTATSLQAERCGCHGYCRGDWLHLPDEGDEFGSDKDVEADPDHLFGCQQLISGVPRQHFLQLHRPLLPIGGAGGKRDRERGNGAPTEPLNKEHLGDMNKSLL